MLGHGFGERLKLAKLLSTQHACSKACYSHFLVKAAGLYSLWSVRKMFFSIYEIIVWNALNQNALYFFSKCIMLYCFPLYSMKVTILNFIQGILERDIISLYSWSVYGAMVYQPWMNAMTAKPLQDLKWMYCLIFHARL